MAIFTAALLDPGFAHGRPGTPLRPQGLVLHSTADPGATAREVRAYFEGQALRFAALQPGSAFGEDMLAFASGADASAHAVVDWAEAIVLVPLDEVAWHAGHTANGLFLGMELCETHDPAQFHDSFLRWIDGARELFALYGWPVVDGQTLRSHKQVSAQWHETDHTDPIDYLAAHGHSWADVVARIKGEVT